MAIELIDYERCTNCGICYETCPMDVFQRVGGVIYVAHPKDCMVCYLCDIDCPEDALVITPNRSRPIIQAW